MGKLGNFWKTMLAGGAGVAALAAVNAAIQRGISEPDDSALGGDAHFFSWKHGRCLELYVEKELRCTGPGISRLCPRPPWFWFLRQTCSRTVFCRSLR